MGGTGLAQRGIAVQVYFVSINTSPNEHLTLTIQEQPHFKGQNNLIAVQLCVRRKKVRLVLLVLKKVLYVCSQTFCKWTVNV